MSKNHFSRSEVIEPEILDESGTPLKSSGAASASYAQRTYRGAGVLSGFVALSVSFILMLLGALVTVFVVLPLLLLGRIVGIKVQSFRR